MVHLNGKSLQAVARELIDSPSITGWISESLEMNRALLEESDSLDDIRQLQGENRVLKQMLEKIPEE